MFGFLDTFTGFSSELPVEHGSAENFEFDWLCCGIRFCNGWSSKEEEVDRITELYNDAREKMERKAPLKSQVTGSNDLNDIRIDK